MARQEGVNALHGVTLNGINSMPLEIKQMICENLCDHCTDIYGLVSRFSDPVSRMPLYNLCLTSRSFRDIAQPVLFHLLTHKDEDVWKKVLPFARTVQENDWLADQVRCILRIPERGHKTRHWRQAAVHDGHRDDLCRSLIMNIAIVAKGIDTLDMKMGNQLMRTGIRLYNLNYLRLDLALGATFWDPFERSAGGYVFVAPRIKALTLRNWPMSRSVCENIVDGMDQIESIKITVCTESPGSDGLELLASGLPNLTALALTDSLFHGDFLCQLLPRKDGLTDIDIHATLIDFSLLVQFPNLKRLQLTCKIINIPYDENETMANTLPIGLAPSLEYLILAQGGLDQLPLASLIRRLSYNLSSYKKLKFVAYRLDVLRAILDRPWWDRISAIIDKEDLRENFRTAGVKAELPKVWW